MNDQIVAKHSRLPNVFEIVNKSVVISQWQDRVSKSKFVKVAGSGYDQLPLQ